MISMRYFNERLKTECLKYGFRFFDVYEQYADSDGFLSRDYSDGNVHIGNGIWLDRFIADLDLKPFRRSEINLPGQALEKRSQHGLACALHSEQAMDSSEILRRYPWAGSLVYTAFSGSHQDSACH